MRRPLLAIVISACTLAAQDGTAAKSAAHLRAAGVQKLAAMWPTTRAGRLFADPDVAPAAQKVLRRHVDELTRRRLTAAEAISGRYELEPWLLSWVSAGRFDPLDLLDIDVTEADRVELLALMLPEQPDTMVTALARSCTPRHEGKWAQEFEQDAARLRASPGLREQRDAKIDGFPAYGFVTKTAEDSNQPGQQRWMVHLPGRFVQLRGGAADGLLDLLADRPAPGISLRLDTAVMMLQFAQRQHTPEDFVMLGFDRLKSFEWRGAFAGEQVLEELVVVTDGAPAGLVGAIVNGKATLPRQPLPDGALVQARCALDLTMLAPIVDQARLGIPAPLLATLPKVLTGGVAVGVCAPAPGGMIPRVHLSLGIADRAALDTLLAQLLGDDIPHKTAEYEGVACTVLQLPDVPNGLQPAFCIVADTLHVAESPRTLRKFLQLLADGDAGEAMHVGDTAVPQGPGELQSIADLRFDEVALYRTFYDAWMPALTFTMNAAGMEMVLQKDDLPEPDTIASYCGFGRGVLRRDGDTWLLQQQGTFGGVDALALMLLWGPAIAAQLRDNMTDNLAEAIAQKKLADAHDALAAFEQREQRRPKDLAELFAAQKLPADALLLPGDDRAEPVQLADGSTTRSSFRYFPATTLWDAGRQDLPAVLIELREHRTQRSVLIADGRVEQGYSADARKPIEAFPGAAGR